MPKNNLIAVHCFDQEIGRVGYDENQHKTTFQYNPEFLDSGLYQNIFPLILKKTRQPQVFSLYNGEAFRGLPPMIADSLPDMFGNLIFKAWLESKHKSFEKISVLEQLTYVANRGMGALEYRPGKVVSKNATIDIEEITGILKKVLHNKKETLAEGLTSASLLNIFKIGTSAGGARPKILVSRHKENASIIPGDLEYSAAYDHYLVKLSIDEQNGYHREVIEYGYYQTATALGIEMMPSELISGKHFATTRFDRIAGKKKHILTASGMTGWDYIKSDNSSYENLFKLAVHLKLSPVEMEELYRRMVFNVVFFNTDDHMKNHSFIYNQETENWALSPAYDITYSLNPELNFTKVSRNLSINNKRMDITLDDLISIAEKFTIKNPKGFISDIQNGVGLWQENMQALAIPEKIIQKMKQDFMLFKV